MLIKHGWHGMHALAALLDEEIENRLYKHYTANALGVMVNAMGGLVGQRIDYPAFTELIGADERKKDKRSGREIVNDVLAKLG